MAKAEYERFKNFLPEFRERLGMIADSLSDNSDEHTAFPYFVAELFATLNEEHFTYSDGANDGGVDFFTHIPPSQYAIFQCKCPDLSRLNDSDEIPQFDKAAVEELLTAVDFITNADMKLDVKPIIRRLKSDFFKDRDLAPQEVRLEAVLAVFGTLTPAAVQLFDNHKKRLKKSNVLLRLITWKDVFDAIQVGENQEKPDIRFDLTCHDIEKDALRHQDYCYMLVRASDLYKAWRKFEWKLFDWNVRLQIKKSPINSKIRSSLTHERDRKKFHHLNNGLLITCATYRLDSANNRIKLEGAQIINGCQTVCAIRDVYEDLEPDEQLQFDEQVQVQVKVIKGTDQELINKLVVTTNDQNPMNTRNLKSNALEQKNLQRQFRELFQKGWFYERKDGELRSLMEASSQVRWFRRSDYAFASRIRQIDNMVMAKRWYSWIGYSHDVLKGGLDYFDTERLYKRIFLNRPNSAFWMRFCKNSIFTANDDEFEPETPSAFEYLLSFSIGELIRCRRIPFTKNRDDTVKRLLTQGRLKETDINDKKKIDALLVNEPDYRVTGILNNMQELLVELFSFVLSERYGTLDANTSQAIVSTPSLKLFLESAFKSDMVPDEKISPDNLIGPIYGFLHYCVKQFYFENQAEIHAASRAKNYLSQRGTVERLKEKIQKTEVDIRDFSAPWKNPGRSFFESLPDLPDQTNTDIRKAA